MAIREARYVIDTREQKPLVLPGARLTCRQKLKTGDYSVKGYTNKITVEYKALGDWTQWISGNKKRFYSQCERLAEMPFGFVVVACPFGGVRRQSPVTPQQSMAATLEVMSMGIPILHTENPMRAAFVTKNLIDTALRRLKEHGEPGARQAEKLPV